MHIRILLAVPLLALGLQASAQTKATQTENVTVSIVITDTCSFLAPTEIAFGPVAAGVTTVAPVTASFDVLCSLGTEYTLGLDGGRNNDVDDREMWHVVTGGTDVISYSLSRETLAGGNWGDTEGTWVSGTGRGLVTGDHNQHQVFAQANLTGTERAGRYEDTVVATLKF